MPGIVGLITKRPRVHAERQLLGMLRTIQHEPFYATGTWQDESLGVYIGWTVRKGSFADGMPVWNESKNTTLVFSGEEFAGPEIKDRLKKHGHSFLPDDASYLAHLYEEEENFPAALNGRFHGLVTDQARHMVTLFND